MSHPPAAQEHRPQQARPAPPLDVVEILGAGLSGLTTAITLARTGRRVVVHDIREESGARFQGDFQAIENWSSDVDFFEEMAQWGLDMSGLDLKEIHSISLIGPDDRVSRLASNRIACRIVRRGVQPGSLDQILKANALRHGVDLRYRSRPDPDACTVIATGPRVVTGIVLGELFQTDHPEEVTIQFNQTLAPNAYTYLVIINGIGLIATVLLQRERNVDFYLDETIASYQLHYPNLQRFNRRRITGSGSFAMADRYKEGHRYYVGEAAGLQDCLWGFGIRYAMTSGYLAAQEMITDSSYEEAVHQRLRPFQIASVANRLAINASGTVGLPLLLKAWKFHQWSTGDGLGFPARLYRPSPLHRLIYALFNQRLLASPSLRGADRGLRHLKFGCGKRRSQATIGQPSNEHNLGS